MEMLIYVFLPLLFAIGSVFFNICFLMQERMRYIAIYSLLTLTICLPISCLVSFYMGKLNENAGFAIGSFFLILPLSTFILGIVMFLYSIKSGNSQDE